MSEKGLLAKFLALSTPVKVVTAVAATTVVVGGGATVTNLLNENEKRLEEEQNKTLVLLETDITIEIGETYSTDVNDYIDTEKSGETAINDAKLDLSGVKTYETNNFPIPGEHIIKITSLGHEYIINFEVIDNLGPEFMTSTDLIEAKHGEKPDYTKYFEAKDSSGVTITADDSKVNYKKAGTYDVVIIATDDLGNESKLEAKVKVLEKEKDVVNNQTTTKPSNGSSNSGSGSNSNTGTSSGNNNSSSNSSENNKEDESVLTNCPYELFEFTFYKGHFGYFWPYSKQVSPERSSIIIEFCPNGEDWDGYMYVGEYADTGQVYFDYYDASPANPNNKKPNKCPYTFYELTYYNGYYGFFLDPAFVDSLKHSTLVVELLGPKGGETNHLDVGQFDDNVYVVFEYNPESPYAPIEK